MPETTLPDDGAATSKRSKKSRRGFAGFSVTLVVLLVVAIIFYINFHTVIVSGHSMDPTFHTGERLLASKAYWLVGPIKDNDVVVIQHEKPGEYIIKRVYKTAGETVDWPNVPGYWKLSEGEFKVPEGDIYVMGDNKPVSEDSRSFGPVPRDKVIGKILLLKL